MLTSPEVRGAIIQDNDEKKVVENINATIKYLNILNDLPPLTRKRGNEGERPVNRERG